MSVDLSDVRLLAEEAGPGEVQETLEMAGVPD